MISAGHPTPDRILGDLWAFRRSAALKAAIELDLFSRAIYTIRVRRPERGA